MVEGGLVGGTLCVDTMLQLGSDHSGSVLSVSEGTKAVGRRKGKVFGA